MVGMWKVGEDAGEEQEVGLSLGKAVLRVEIEVEGGVFKMGFPFVDVSGLLNDRPFERGDFFEKGATLEVGGA